MILRSIGKALLGTATPFQIRAGALLGGALGFTADLERAPALTVGLVVLLLVLNTNIWLATVVALAGVGLNVLLLPVTFHVGRILLDGPLQGLFASAINAPVLALFGFEYYAITGGLVLGIVFGAVVGAALNGLVRRTREAFLKADAGSDRFRAISGRRSVRVASWLLLGATPSREAYEKLAGKRVGNPVRIWGMALAVAIVVGVFVASKFLAGPFLGSKLRAGLERANGATVDLKALTLDLAKGRLSLEGLAMADQDDVFTDIFRSVTVEANLSGEDLLRKRLRFDRIVVDFAASGVKRELPGSRTGTGATPQEAPPGETPPAEEGYKSIDDYLNEAEKWKERLAQLRGWIDRFTSSEKPESKEKLEERLRRQVREQGYAWTAADHLVRGAPTLLISELRIERLEALQLGGKQLNVVGTNLSTHPSLSPAPPHLVVKAEDGSLLFEIGSKDGARALSFSMKGIDGDAVGRAIRGSPIKGGKVDLAVSGTLEGSGGVNLKLDATLLGTTITVPGVKEPQRIDRLVLPLAIKGTLDDPRVLFRNEDLTKALVAAGRKELASKLTDEAGKRLGDDARKALEGLLGGK